MPLIGVYQLGKVESYSDDVNAYSIPAISIPEDENINKETLLDNVELHASYDYYLLVAVNSELPEKIYKLKGRHNGNVKLDTLLYCFTETTDIERLTLIREAISQDYKREFSDLNLNFTDEF